ncbi:FkbM family methyltransferase [Roseicitreum antarcticum]|uniref:Methyltransferase, FkbM family n=1 Tax=Roseicitreum antarcticum TaxID=564137 RepID=A0A1H2URI4_9RHOB|nr:FkbM family methyltransferase [Roseicitreum antarcticum]SDW58164.1 methyltransferase, FkbM family [Roseicitreum antarcticum]
MNKLYVKHRLATSAIAGPISVLREVVERFHTMRYPELGLLHREPWMMNALLPRLVRRDSHCLDIGGHIGSVSYMLRKLAPQGSLTIVEASPEKAGWLRQRFPTDTVHEVAVSNQRGEISFFENLTNAGYSSLTARESRGQIREIRVTCTRIDDLLDETAKVDFIKIDVEGHEYEALCGARNLLDRCKPVILFEAGSSSDADIAESANTNVFRLLSEDLDYEIYAIFDLYFGRGPIDLAQFAIYRSYPYIAFNYIALPRGMTLPTG